MLQIIGWLGCAYLIVKALEMNARPDFREHNGRLAARALWAISLAILFAGVFVIWLALQGGSFIAPTAATAGEAALASPPADTQVTQAQVNCIANAKTGDESLACTK